MFRGVGKIRSALNQITMGNTELRKRLWQQWTNPSGYSTPAFLLGCGRSGTSMLVKQLSRSRRVDLYNEDNPAAFERWRLRDLSVIEALVELSHAQIVLFKPILDTYRSQTLLARFPKAKLIFTFRHYDDVINSSLKRFGIPNRLSHIQRWVTDNFSEFSTFPPPEKTKELIRSRWNPNLSPESGAALYWLFYNQLYFDLDLDRESSVRLVRYESIVSNPVNELESICQFLGLPYESQIAEGIFSSSVNRNPSPGIDPVIRSDCEALWLKLCQHQEDPVMFDLNSNTRQINL